MAESGNNAETPWQFSKSANECNRFMLDKELYSDVTFLVGDEDTGVTQIKAHRYILISRSPVFEGMLCGEVKNESPIKIPDTDDKTFKSFLRYLYHDDFPENPGSLLPLLYLATKYLIPALEHQCEDRLKGNINNENVCLILEQSLSYGKTNLSTHCMTYIRVEMKNIVKQKTFLDVSQKILRFILEDDDLLISELEVFESCLSWGKNQCRLTRQPLNGETIRKVLGDALYCIRFPTMTSATLADRVAPMNILTQTEMLQLFILAAGANAENKTKFISKQREGNSAIKCCERFAGFEPSGSWSHLSGPDAIAFKTDRNIYFNGLQVFLSDDVSSRHSIEVKLYQGKRCLKSVSCETSGGPQQKEVYSMDPVPIKKDYIYDLVLRMIGPNTVQGKFGKHVITSHGVKFNFLSSNMDENGTNIAVGQIPGILFTLQP